MKDIHYIEIDGSHYAVGLEWEEIPPTKSTNVMNEIRSISKRKGKDFGCKITKSSRRQIGFSKSSNKNQTVAACLISKQLKDTLFVKKISNADNWICYVDPEGLIANNKEGVFDESELLDIIDDLKLLGDLVITCSEEDRILLFEDEEDCEIRVVGFSEIIANTKKTNDDIVQLLYKERNIVKIASSISIAVVVAALSYYFLYNEDPLYNEIVNQELSTPLDAKEAKFKKVEKENKEFIMKHQSINSGKKMLIEKVETNIYTKEEIFNYLLKMHGVYPLYLKEWELESFKFTKEENNADIKFSVVYKRILTSVGFYDEINKTLLDLSNSKMKPLKVVTYPGDLNNNTIITDLYFKEPKVIGSGVSEEDAQKALKDKMAKFDKELVKIKENISDNELKVSQEFGFFDKRFGSALSDVAEEIEASVQSGNKIYDQLIKLYENMDKEDIVVPDSYTDGSKIQFLNIMQEYSTYAWDDAKKAETLPPPPSNTSKKGPQIQFTPYVNVWKFNIQPKEYLTKGIDPIKNIFAILNKTAIGIYTVDYKTENETWYIKGELYEKN